MPDIRSLNSVLSVRKLLQREKSVIGILESDGAYQKRQSYWMVSINVKKAS